MYKKLSNSKADWCHITCALFSKSMVRVTNYNSMDLEAILEKRAQPGEEPASSKLSKKCQICDGPNELVKCMDAECNQCAHPYCILKSMTSQFNENQGEGESPAQNWVLKLVYDSKISKFNLLMDGLSESLRSQIDEKLNMAGMQFGVVEKKQVVKENKNPKKKSKKSQAADKMEEEIATYEYVCSNEFQ